MEDGHKTKTDAAVIAHTNANAAEDSANTLAHSTKSSRESLTHIPT